MSAEPMPSIDSELLQEYRAYLRDGFRITFAQAREQVHGGLGV